MFLDVRYLNESGFAIEARRIKLPLNVFRTIQDITSVLGNTAIPASATALEVVQIYQGYIFFHTGANPTALEVVTTACLADVWNTQSAMVLPGDIIGVASYVRPLNAVLGRAGILTRPINRVFTANVASGDYFDGNAGVVAPPSAPPTNPAQIVVVPNRFNRLLFDVMLGAPGTAGQSTSVTLNVRFTPYRYDANSVYVDAPGTPLRVGVPTQYAQVMTRVVSNPTNFRGTYEFPCPNPGRYMIETQLTVGANGLTSNATTPTTSIQCFHEVWS